MISVCTILLVFVTGSALGQCQSNWIRHGGSCYHFSHDVENWPDSMILCKAVDAYLVEINDASENSFLKNNMIADGSWIGMADLAEEGVWKWMHSQTDPSYTNWQPNEPNNSGQNENCAMFDKSSGAWNDGACMTGFHYVCERTLEGIDEVVG